MLLPTETRIGPYEIVAPIGAGGMGEVYRATDTRLGRDVAIKVLPASFAQDADRRARFEREAKTLAAINHANIAQIFGFEEFDLPTLREPQGCPEQGRGATGTEQHRVSALVMELVEGEDLSEQLARGALPIEDAVAIAKQVADALESAHEQGIVHRDLKPANIKIKADGTVKVLDFGLAKAMDPSGSSAVDTANSPTLTGRATHMGVILGTASYMAPEQARGRAVDRRADIWAFGVVLYEMLTARRVFRGDDVSDVLASVLRSEPDWTALPDDTPVSVRRLLRRCLEKDPRKRLSAIADARLDLDESETAATDARAPAARRSLLARYWPTAAGLMLAVPVAWLFWPTSRPASDADVLRLSMIAPPGVNIYPDSAAVTISPDGRWVAFVTGDAMQGDTQSQLWVRPLDSTTARRIESGDGVRLPFWSPDSRRIGFFAGGKLKVVPVTGGRAEVLCEDAPAGRGGAWSRSNVILFAPDASGPIYRVSANGGERAAVTTLDAARKESGHRFPVFLPDGEHFVFAALPAHGGKFDIFAGSVRDGSRTMIGSMETAPVYAEPGWLLYTRQGVLAAQPFDPRTRQVTGEAVSLGDEPTSILNAAYNTTAAHAISVSSSGLLAYFLAPSVNTTAVWLDASGRVAGTLSVPPAQYSGVTISPDGNSAVLVRPTSRTESSLWLVDLARSGAAPLSSGPGLNDSPVWSPDSSRVAFASDRNGAQHLFVKNVADASPEQPIYQSDVMFKSPEGWSPDGNWIIFRQIDPVTGYDIWLLPMSGESKPVSYLRGPVRDRGGWPSPDGRWLAYVSDDTGREELYVQSFPVPGHKVQVSTEGAGSGAAWWTHDRRQLLFVSPDARTLWRVDVESGATLQTRSPKQVATLPPNLLGIDAMPDGKRFIALVPERVATGAVTIVRNWQTALGRPR